MTNRIKVKVNNRQYTACFYDSSFGQIKELKTNEAVDIEEYEDHWAIYFEYKDNTDYTLEVKLELNEYGERTSNVIEAALLDEEGIIMDYLRI